MRVSVIDWLLDSDPSIRWQVMRDLVGESEERVARERSRVAKRGGERACSTFKDRMAIGAAPRSCRGLDLHEDTLQLLRDLGVDPTSGSNAQGDPPRSRPLTWGAEFGNAPFFEGEVEPCINGRVLAIGAYFGEASDRLIDRLLQEQLSRRRLEL